MYRPRVTYFRYRKGKMLQPKTSGYSDYDRVITIAWITDKSKKILRYGATVFTKDDNRDCWVKKKNREIALTRLNFAPIKICHNKPLKLDINEDFMDMDRVIINHYMLKYGAWEKNSIEKIYSNRKIIVVATVASGVLITLFQYGLQHWLN